MGLAVMLHISEYSIIAENIRHKKKKYTKNQSIVICEADKHEFQSIGDEMRRARNMDEKRNEKKKMNLIKCEPTATTITRDKTILMPTYIGMSIYKVYDDTYKPINNNIEMDTL